MAPLEPVEVDPIRLPVSIVLLVVGPLPRCQVVRVHASIVVAPVADEVQALNFRNQSPCSKVRRQPIITQSKGKEGRKNIDYSPRWRSFPNKENA